MKKLKFMLLSFAMVAVVGGALAFKAKYSTSYCTGVVPASGICLNAACPNLVIHKTTAGGVAPFVCTTTPVAGACNGDCTTTSTKLIAD